MKLRLTQPGFENYTAQMGVTFFEEGLSTADVLPMDATRMAAVMQCEWEDGSPANVGQIYLDNMHTPAGVDVVVERETPAVISAPSVKYTEQELGDIADKEGIAGLRAIADAFGIKGNSINGLIASILTVAAA